jgi:hypothetical protein
MKRGGTKKTQPAAWPPWARLAVTVGWIVFGAALPYLRLGLPGIDPSMLTGTAKHRASVTVFELGIWPLCAAMVVVELVSAVVPALRPVRNGGSAGRAKLARPTLVLAAALAVFRGYGVAHSVANAAADPAFSSALVTLSLVAGTFLLILGAQFVSERGLASGLALTLFSWSTIRYVEAVVDSHTKGVLPARYGMEVLVAATGVAVATWFVFRRRRPSRVKSALDYRTPPLRQAEPVALPSPASGVALLAIAGSARALVDVLEGAGLPLLKVEHLLFRSETTHLTVSVLLIAALGVGLSWLFNAPSRVAGVFFRARAGAGEAGEDEEHGEERAALEAEARRAGRDAALRSVVFLLALHALGRATLGSDSYGMSFALFAGTTALVLDIVDEWRAWRASPDLVVVWPEHRPYGAEAAREALAAAGICVHARGERLRALLQFLGPFVPIDLMVRRADAKRATAILERVLPYHPEDEPDESRRGRAAPRRFTRLELGMVGAAIALAVAPVLFARARAPASPPRSHAPPRPEALQLIEVDDDEDIFEPHPPAPPSGISIMLENVPRGPGRSESRHYARIVAADGETLENARARLLGWAEPIARARALRVALEAVSEQDDETGKTRRIGWRTFLLRGAPVLDGSDVKEAWAVPNGEKRASEDGWHVAVALGDAGAERFRAFTATHVKRRLAIVVDGRVASAPVILSEIPGGSLTITPASQTPEEQLAEARALEDELVGRPQP